MGEKIRNIRRKLCMTQKEFAKYIGVSRATVCNWETNTVEMNILSLKKIHTICKEKGIDFDSLF